MFRRALLVVSLILVAASFAWAEEGPTAFPLELDNPEIVDALLTPDGLTPPPARRPIGAKAAEPIGARFLQYIDEYEWTVNPAVGELDGPTFKELSQTMLDAVDLAPEWLRMHLAHRFFELAETTAELLAGLIVDPPDERYRDELAFLVAHSSRNDLQGNEDIEAFLVANVAAIYDYDEFLDYVEVIDSGESGEGDYGTTLRYNVLVDEDVEIYDLPREVYYWNVVHPKLDVEGPDFINPLDGRSAAPEDGGVFFRDYLMFDVEGEGSYHTPMYFAGVDEADLQNLLPSARGYLTDMGIHNLEIAYQAGTNDVVFAEFAYGSGQVFATTLRLAAAFTDNGCPLLENLLNQGCGDVLLNEGARIALLGDTIPAEFETALTNLGRWGDTTQITTAQLTAYTDDDWAALKSTYDKVVVPPYQSLDFYTLITEETVRGKLHEYITGDVTETLYNVLQMHLATDDADDPAGLVFPGNFTVTPQATNETDAITLYGRPILVDMLTGIDVLWDGIQVTLSGDRPLWDNATAIEAVGNWAGKNMLDNIAERYALDARVERSLHPVRIAYNHFGNCGELQDLGSAAMRAALIPGGLVSTINEDHVWSEFYANDEWHAFQNDWSNGANNIDNPGICYDNPDPDVGKNISFVVFWYGDGRIEQVPERYTAHITIDFVLTDANGDPVPDAVIDIYSEGWMSSSKYQGAWLVTDPDGRATINLGDWRNYFVHIEAEAGVYPGKKGEKVTLARIVVAEDAAPDSHFTFEHQFEGATVKVTETPVEPENDSYALHLTFDATDRLASVTSALSSARAYYEMGPPSLDVFLVDADNRENARRNRPFEAALAWMGVTSFDEVIYPPDDRDWTLLVTHHTTMISDHLLDIDLTVEGEPYDPPPGDDDDTADDDAIDDDAADDDATDDDATDDDAADDDDDDDDDSGCGC